MLVVVNAFVGATVGLERAVLGMAGLASGLFASHYGLSLAQTSMLAALYPVTWGVCQLATGPMSDRWGRKRPIVAGMLIQGGALVAVAVTHGYVAWE